MNELAKIEKNSLVAAIHSGNFDVEVPFRREIFLLHTGIAGCQFRENIKEIAAEIKEGDTLTFKREPDNEHDKLAILVLDPKGRAMGYVPMRDNKVIARLLDAGKNVYAIFGIKHYDNNEELSKEVLDNVSFERKNGERISSRNNYFDYRIDIFMRD